MRRSRNRSSLDRRSTRERSSRERSVTTYNRVVPTKAALQLMKEYKQLPAICPKMFDMAFDPSYTKLLETVELHEKLMQKSREGTTSPSYMTKLTDMQCMLSSSDETESKQTETSSFEFNRKSRFSSLFSKVKFLKYRRSSTKEDVNYKSISKEKEVEKEEELIQFPSDICLQKFNDEADLSRNPSYSKVTMPYNLFCLNRIREQKRRYEKQFQSEIKQILEQMPNAFEMARFHSFLAYTSLWPPLHTKHEIEYTSNMFKLSPKQQSRLNYIMSNEIT
ncbi:uncharacterized protein LOC119682556 [Teleopsis dalmanni]|uniref:uncharacterized protein LOC119679521 n=1 Tax=Teleopsis dalmanni TaxID=139649 RepID=UPI0018CEBA51|nr:uncharacterized protein LOC119679521 [Teleopsis dalmanni]XP_037951955.1 uncharacterized protein LOC119682556 [Teleopsis dalmanni]